VRTPLEFLLVNCHAFISVDLTRYIVWLDCVQRVSFLMHYWHVMLLILVWSIFMVWRLTFWILRIFSLSEIWKKCSAWVNLIYIFRSPVMDSRGPNLQIRHLDKCLGLIKRVSNRTWATSRLYHMSALENIVFLDFVTRKSGLTPHFLAVQSLLACGADAHIHYLPCFEQFRYFQELYKVIRVIVYKYVLSSRPQCLPFDLRFAGSNPAEDDGF
jgi:hypothetical protein